MELECKGEFCAGLFFRIGSIAVFGFGSKGLHDAEFRIFSENVIHTGAPRGKVIPFAAESPGITGTIEPYAIFRINIFYPDVPGFRRRHFSFAIGQFPYPQISAVIAVSIFPTVAEADIFIVSQQIPFGTEVYAGICTPKVVAHKTSIVFCVARAVEGTEFECMKDAFKGPTIIGLALDHPGAAARIFKEFAKTNDKFQVKALAFEGKFYEGKDIDVLASLPTYEEGIAKLLATMKEAAAGKLARTLKAYADKLEAEGGAAA